MVREWLVWGWDYEREREREESGGVDGGGCKLSLGREREGDVGGLSLWRIVGLWEQLWVWNLREVVKRVWVWVLKFFIYICFQEKVYQEDKKVQKEKN